jgi:hypothetical protein
MDQAIEILQSQHDGLGLAHAQIGDQRRWETAGYAA